MYSSVQHSGTFPEGESLLGQYLFWPNVALELATGQRSLYYLPSFVIIFVIVFVIVFVVVFQPVRSVECQSGLPGCVRSYLPR